jgi:protein-disulfide isomerase
MVVFGVMAIFSTAYRPVAKEAFDCVFRRITLRKCQSGLDTRLKSKITGKLMVRSPKAARVVHRYFEVFSWFFVILFFASLAYSGYAVYNFAAYGNCNGPDSSAFCVFDPFKNTEETHCSISGETKTTQSIKKLTIEPNDPSTGPKNAPVTIIEAGCFQCYYTKLAVPWVKKLLKEYDGKVRLVYKDFPVTSSHPTAHISAEAARCANDQDKFWTYSDMLFANQNTNTTVDLKKFAKDIGLDTQKFNACLDSRKYQPIIQKEFDEASKSGIYGTPTFFINDQVIVGPKSYKELKKAVEEELK